MIMKKKIAALAIATAPMLLLAGCSKPEQSEVKTGLVKIFTKSGATADQANQLADCIVPQIMDFDKATLDNIADGEDKVTTDDAAEFKKIGTDCAAKVTK